MPGMVRGIGGVCGGLLLAFMAACEADDRPPKLSSTPEGCWPGVPSGYEVECRWVEVPEDHADPASASISLPVVHFFSAASDAALDPVVYLEGGPGGSGIQTVTGQFERFAPLLEDRDLIVFDQRGTGRARPVLECREFDALPSDASLAQERQALAACRERLTGAGVDVAAYSTAENAADVESLRAALGYDQWNLYGISYGTRLALTVMRDHPAGVRSAVLDSVLPLELDFLVETANNGEEAFRRVFAACAAQPACLDAYPDPMDTLMGVLDGLVQSPRAESLPDGTPYTVTSGLVMNILFLLLYDSETVSYLPATIDMLADGDYSVISAVLGALVEDGLVTAGMYLSVICQDEVPFTSREKLAAAGAALSPHFREFFADESIFDDCEVWEVPASPASENQPVTADLPTLVVSGSLDPITPPAYARQVAQALPDAHEYELVGQAHAASLSPCGTKLVRSFLKDPAGPIDDACAATLTVAPFLTRSRAAGSFALHAPSPEVVAEIAERAKLNAQRLRRGATE